MRLDSKPRILNIVVTILFLGNLLTALESPYNPKAPWNPDNGDGTFTNPIIHADYSDPDVIRVDDDYYMVASSFSHFPGLPILHSKDLVNWKIIGHAIQDYPFPEFGKPQHGMGVWAPAIRYRNGEFMIYFGDPDRGIFLTKAKNPAGPWDPLQLIRKVTGWIDPCPLWDDDGNAYLVHAFANSRVGIKSILAVNRMSSDGITILDDGIIVFVGHYTHPTLEGPKFYKRNGYYYIFAPAGGVKNGWQTILRSKNVFGPYEYRNALAQGNTNINGPHQGAWIDTKAGEDWFIHFQDRYAYGRITHLQPMHWEFDWPVIGINQDSTGCGEPVKSWKKPNVGKDYPMEAPQTSDEFDTRELGLQWQWQADIRDESFYSLVDRANWLRLFAQPLELNANLYTSSAILLQKFPSPSFSITTKMDVTGLRNGDKGGLIIFGLDYAYIGIEHTGESLSLIQNMCKKADKGSQEKNLSKIFLDKKIVWLRAEVHQESDTSIIPRVLCTFSYSIDGTSFRFIEQDFIVREGYWVGAKAGLFTATHENSAPLGYADFDNFIIEHKER